MALSFDSVVGKKGKAMTGVKHWIKNHSSQNIPLMFSEAYELGRYAIEGCRGNVLAQIQSIAVLTALHNRATYLWRWSEKKEKLHGHRLPKTSAEQIAGICAAIFEHDIGKSEFGFLQPNILHAMDNCGMGGDLIITANVSTIAAFIASAAGITMCKHGSPANADEGRHGSSDFISLCGINGFSVKKEAEKCLESLGFGYTEATDTRYKLLHTQTHNVARLPHMNDIVGPITNPLDPKLLTRRVLGVNHLIPPRVIAEAYLILNERGITNLERGIFLRGFGEDREESGMDELSICKGGTQIAELKKGDIKEYWLYAQDFGLQPVAQETISPPLGVSKGDFSLAILQRKMFGSPAQMIAANAAILLWLADKSSDLKECYVLAEEILRSGQAHQKMLDVRNMSPIKEEK